MNWLLTVSSPWQSCMEKAFCKYNHTLAIAMHWMPNASSYCSLSLKSAYKCHEDAKKCIYGHRVRDIEHDVFTPLIFTSTGGMGCEATVFYRHLADLLATHWGQEYSQTISWFECRLSFALHTSMCHHVYPRKQVFCTSSCAWATRLISGPCWEQAD